MFRQLFDPESSTYTYLLADDATHEAVLIDPVLEQAGRDLALVREHGLKLRWTLETHVHADHVTGALAISEALGKDTQTAVSRDCNAQGYDRLLTDGDVVLFGHDQIMVIATPGHTSGSVSFLWRDRIFTGDTLLIGGCGRTDFQGGSAAALYHSITQKLFTLDEQTLVYPGHDYKGRRVSSIGEEKQFNARLTGKSEAEFVHIMDTLNLPSPRRIHEAVPANLAGGGPRQDGQEAEPPPVTSGTRPSHVSPRQLAEQWQAGSGQASLIDVRTPGEFETLRVAGAINIPLDRLNAAALAGIRANQTLYCICQTGARSQIAADKLRTLGYAVVHVDGGTNAWQEAGLPVLQGERKIMAMERQVRIAAGGLVALGVLAGALLHPAGYLLAAAIGAGLVYSGISNTCTMALVLAKMPWNRASA